jgi:anthranilate phosphoribosyltransferase
MNFSHHLHTPYPEHPFAEIIRILGKGKKGSRSLTQDEAYRAMSMIVNEQVLPEQLGAFLMLMRVKEETPDELAGFVRAVRDSLPLLGENTAPVDLDWSSYAGKRRHLPWFLLVIRLLIENGVSVFMHGSSGYAPGRLYTEEMLPFVGLKAADSWAQARQQLTESGFSYLSLAHFCPKLHALIELRPIMGLRSPVHTLVRMLNPFSAAYSIQGIFHPNYRPMHQQASALLQQPHMAVIKGEGGEIERNPDMPCLVQSLDDGVLTDENWPPLFERRHLKPEQLDPRQLALLWRGESEDDFAKASVTGTLAIVLKLLGKAGSPEEAQSTADQWWIKRDKSAIP